MGRKRAYTVISYIAVGSSLFFSSVTFSISLALILYHYCVIHIVNDGSDLEGALKFLYFRSSHCEFKFDWKFLDIENLSVEVHTTNESVAARRTLVFAMLYFISSAALMVTAVVAIYGMNRQKGCRCFNYTAFCVPWIVSNFLDVILCLTAAVTYIIDYSKIKNDITYLLDLLEVINVDEVRPILVKHQEMALYHAVIPSQFMYFNAAKWFFPLLFCLVLGLMAIKSMWEVIDENKRVRVYFRDEI